MGAMARGSMVADIKVPACDADTENCCANSASKGCGAYKTKKINIEHSNRWMTGIPKESF